MLHKGAIITQSYFLILRCGVFISRFPPTLFSSCSSPDFFFYCIPETLANLQDYWFHKETTMKRQEKAYIAQKDVF